MVNFSCCFTPCFYVQDCSTAKVVSTKFSICSFLKSASLRNRHQLCYNIPLCTQAPHQSKQFSLCPKYLLGGGGGKGVAVEAVFIIVVISLCRHVLVYSSAHRDRRCQPSLQLISHAVECCLIWVLATKLQLSVKAVRALECRTISLVLMII